MTVVPSLPYCQTRTTIRYIPGLSASFGSPRSLSVSGERSRWTSKTVPPPGNFSIRAAYEQVREQLIVPVQSVSVVAAISRFGRISDFKDAGPPALEHDEIVPSRIASMAARTGARLVFGVS